MPPEGTQSQPALLPASRQDHAFVAIGQSTAGWNGRAAVKRVIPMAKDDYKMEQGEFTGRFCAKPQNFAWFLGAGASATAGLPTATDILWDMKRRYFCREENQEISRQDLQNEAVRAKIQAY